MRSRIATFLRYLATKIDGGESDADLRARMLNLVRRGPMRGASDDIESVIRNSLPATLEPVFEWSDDRRAMTMRLL